MALVKFPTFHCLRARKVWAKKSLILNKNLTVPTFNKLLFVTDNENHEDVRNTKDPGGKINGICNSKELVNGNCNEEIEKGEIETNEKGDGDKKEEPEVVFIQDMGFTVKIVSPGTEAFDIQVKLKNYFNS